MATTTLPTFLRARRERVQPATTARRRTPGLRREEVATRAGVSVTWYTWLEQGRGGVPSDDVLERLARALELDDVNREMLFLLAHDRPPPRKPAPRKPALTTSPASAALAASPASPALATSPALAASPPAVTPALQLVLDSLSVPAFLKTPTFQIIAWNRAAVAVISDYAAVPERDRNLLRRLFQPGSETRVHQVDDVRRTCLAAFRVDIARAGHSAEATALIDELMETSPDFRRLWAEGEIRSHGGFQKRIVRPGVGEIALEASVFSVEGSDGLSMLVLSPVNEASARAVAELVRRSGA